MTQNATEMRLLLEAQVRQEVEELDRLMGRPIPSIPTGAPFDDWVKAQLELRCYSVAETSVANVD